MTLGKVLVQPLGLRHRPRKAVQDEAACAIRLCQAAGDHSYHQLVAHQLASLDGCLGGLAQLRPATNIVAKEVAGRNLRNCKEIDDPLRPVFALWS